MGHITIDAVVEALSTSKGWFRRLCEVYEVEQLRQANRESHKLYHLRDTSLAIEEDTGRPWRTRRAPFRDTGSRNARVDRLLRTLGH